MKKLKELKSKLENDMKKSSKIFIIGHNSPDFDAIGACIGIYQLAKFYKKQAYIIVEDDESKIEPGVKKIIDSIKSKYTFIKRDDYLKSVDQESLLVVCDVNKKNMISIGNDLEKLKRIIIIDHHTEDNYTIDTKDKFISLKYSSACEIVASILNMSKVPYDSKVANYLLAGISLDTKRFKQNTTSKTHDVAEKLLDHGAEIDYVNNLFLEEFESYCRISNLIINGTVIKKYSDSLLAPIQVSFTLDRTNPTSLYLKEDYAKAADKMLKFYGIDASFALGYVENGIVHISARSTKKVDVGKIMKELQGGGNSQSAGARICTNDILSLENTLIETIPIGISKEEELIEKPKTIKIKKMKK